jgi:hypothetical protein
VQRLRPGFRTLIVWSTASQGSGRSKNTAGGSGKITKSNRVNKMRDGLTIK